MRAAVERAIRFDAMSHDFAMAVRARRRQQMNRALEAVEGVRRVALQHLEGLVVVIAAHFTLSHHAS